MPIKTRDEASQRAYQRWRHPEVVERRVDSLAEIIRQKIDALPPLTEAQRAKLAGLLRSGGGRA